ncbi:MAG: hypothetical protein OXC37_03015 [Bdellovibrionaceae bacterium]|nr:hypothetical protein [Pseudobdellovibrionaceae bacterium]
MAYKKLPSLFLFLLAFVAISLSGYQCATQQFPVGRDSLPLDQNPGPYSGNDTNDNYYPDDYFEDQDEIDNRLPREIDDGCSRSQLRDLSNKAQANFEFNTSSLQDFRFGASENFEEVCARLYLDMSHQQGSLYRGTLDLALQTNSRIFTFKGFKSGFSSSDNRYNKWSRGSWRGDRNGKVDKEFHAIFEDEHSALILKLEDVRIRDIEDGEETYIGAGKIYYKMFRIATLEDTRSREGSCFSSGTYVRNAHTPPTRRPDRCWLLTYGPFNCRPEGALDVRASFKDIDITADDYRCFSELGEFWGLDIEEAFNDSIEDIK